MHFLLSFDRIFDDFPSNFVSGGYLWGLRGHLLAARGVQVRFFDEFWKLQGLILEPWRHPWRHHGATCGPKMPPRCAPEASKFEKRAFGNDVEQKSSKMMFQILFFNDFLMFFVWLLSAFLKRWVRTFGINTQKQNTHFVSVFAVFYAHRAFVHHKVFQSFLVLFLCVFCCFCECFCWCVFSSILSSCFIDFGLILERFGHIWHPQALSQRVLGASWPLFERNFAHVFAQLRSNTIFSEIWCPSPPPQDGSRRQRPGTLWRSGKTYIWQQKWGFRVGRVQILQNCFCAHP